MSKVTNRAYRAIDVAGVSGEKLGAFSARRIRHEFLNGERRGKAARFSAGDCAVNVVAATLTRRGFNAPDAIKWAEEVRAPLETAMGEQLELGRIRKRPRFTVEQEAIGGLEHIAPVVFDLAAVVEWTVSSLGIPVPSPRPTTKEAKEFLAAIRTPEFAKRLAALKAEIDERNPRTWSWADVERVCGIPEWFCLWALDSPRTDACKALGRVRDQLPEVRA